MTDKKANNTVVAAVPEDKKGEPFVLIWAERRAMDVLKAENLVFSEAMSGLEQETLGDTPGTTGSQPETADTTFPS